MQEYTKYKLKLLGEDVLWIIGIFVFEFILLSITKIFANNTMYLVFLWSMIIGGICSIMSSFLMNWGGAGESRDFFFLFIIGVSWITGPLFMSKYIF